MVPLGRDISQALESAREAFEAQWERDEREAEALRQRKIEALALIRRLPVVLQGDSKALAARLSSARLQRLWAKWTWSAGSVAILGKSGIGKSTAAALVIRRLLGVWVRGGADDDRRILRASWRHAVALEQAQRIHPLGQGDPVEIVEASSAPLLVLDDAGQDRDPLPVSRVLTARHERGLPTLLTSGRTETELVDHYGAAIVRKLLESGGKDKGALVDCFETT